MKKEPVNKNMTHKQFLPDDLGFMNRARCFLVDAIVARLAELNSIEWIHGIEWKLAKEECVRMARAKLNDWYDHDDRGGGNGDGDDKKNDYMCNN